MKYVVNVTETLRRRVIVDAEDFEDAEHKVEAAYNDGKIELDYKDYNGYDITASRIAYGGDIERYEELEV
jgi:hypothetical protein